MACINRTTFKGTASLTADDSQVPGACQACTAGCTVAGTYPSSPCQPAQDLVCSACSTSCNAGYYQTAQCTLKADLQCAACVVNCSSGWYHGNSQACDGTTRTDVVLAGCVACKGPGTCQAGVSYMPDGQCPGTTSTDASCVACTQGVTCPAGFFVTGCNRSNTDFHCQAFTACPLGAQYLYGFGPAQDGVCRPCSPTCDSRGLRLISLCGQYADVVCGGQTCTALRLCDMSLGSQLYCQYFNATNGYCLPCPVRPVLRCVLSSSL